ncbi:S8 family serine peptidase [Streptomyces sp. NPDC006551]|uniref:S8 family serine peptidase n=1 Tax=Streptomyces sp. NPDC006551 TaxID=3157178 RepID=UPI0033B9C88C
MAKTRVLLEVQVQDAYTGGFAAFEDAAGSESSAYAQITRALTPVTGLGVEPDPTLLVIPMFTPPMPGAGSSAPPPSGLSAFGRPETNDDMPPVTVVLPVEVDRGNLEALRERSGVVGVWPNSRLQLHSGEGTSACPGTKRTAAEAFDRARSRAGVDCRPFRPAVDTEVVRHLLGVSALWRDGLRGQNVTVGILDEGVDGATYPVVGGFTHIGSDTYPGSAPVTSHGSMCAADVLVAAPAARLYDYPFIGVPDSGGALAMFQAVLDQRRIDGTPHLTTSSYGYASVPPPEESPGSEIHDIDHPLHRKVREVVASGVAAFFSAGNCGSQCPSSRCKPSGIGPGKSIHASNSLAEVITVAAVNSFHERIGYSAEGPGMFEPKKPDLATYTHFFGNFGPGRPGGTDVAEFDNGTSASAPLAAGAAALLLSAFPGMSPQELRDALTAGLINVTGTAWDAGYGRGILNVAASYWHLLHKC